MRPLFIIALVLLGTAVHAGNDDDTAFFVVDTVPLASTKTNRPSRFDMRAVLVAGDRCTTSTPTAPSPRWRCDVDGVVVEGFAPRRAFSAASPTAKARSETAFDALRERAVTGTAVDDDLLFAAHLLLWRSFAARCAHGEADACRYAAAGAVQRYATLRASSSVPSPSSPASGHCAEGAAVDACLQERFGATVIRTSSTAAPGRVAFHTAKKEGDGVRYVAGIIDVDGATARSFRVTHDEHIVEPSFPTLTALSAPLDVQLEVPDRDFFLPARGTVLALPRTLTGGAGLQVVCADRIVALSSPQALPMGVAETVMGDMSFMGGVGPLHRYRLPCADGLVVDARVGLRVGPLKKATTTTTTTTSPFASCTTTEDGGRGCRLHRRGDFNGDGRDDAFVTHTGEMGCGGHTLYLSTPTGWTAAATSGWYC